MDDLLSLIDTDEKSNDSNASEVIKKPKSSKKNELKSPNKKRKRLSDDNDEEMCTNIEEEIAAYLYAGSQLKLVFGVDAKSLIQRFQELA